MDVIDLHQITVGGPTSSGGGRGGNEEAQGWEGWWAHWYST